MLMMMMMLITYNDNDNDSDNDDDNLHLFNILCRLPICSRVQHIKKESYKTLVKAKKYNNEE